MYCTYMEPKRRPREQIKFEAIDKETKYHQGKDTKKQAKDRHKALLSFNLITYLKFSVISKNILYKDIKYVSPTVRYL